MALLGNLTGSSHLNFQDSTAGFYNGVATTSFRMKPGVVLTDECDAPTSAKIMSFGGWVKRDKIGFYSNLFSGSLGGSGVPQASVYFDTDNALKSISYTGSAYVYDYRTTQLFRDTSAWYHIWVQIDTTDGTQADRFKLYVNGVKVTSFSNAGVIADGSPDIRGFNEDGITAYFGHTNASYGGNVYYSDWYFIDGLAVSPIDNVGEFKNGVFIPKSYSPTFGNNGFNLKFDQVGIGSPSSSTIGADNSGSSRHFASTVGTDAVASDCAMPDSPENNFCTWNPLTAGAQTTFTEGNLKLATVWSADLSGSASTFFPESGKWYWELRVDGAGTYPYIGITSQEKIGYSVNGGTFYSIGWSVSGASQTSGSSLGTVTKENIPSFADDDIMSIALDCDARKIWVAENNTYADSGDPANGSGENASWTVDVGVSPFISGYNGQGVGTVANFGQDDTFAGAISSAGNTDGNGKGVFKYAPPSGFLSLCTANLPEPTIGANSDTQADNYFGTLTWSGDDVATRNIATGESAVIGTVDFTPDWSWIKRRNGASNGSDHLLLDIVRGVDAFNGLSSNGTQAEGLTEAGSTWVNFGDINNFETGGFTVQKGTDGSHTLEGINQSGGTYVGWNWKAGGSASSNTDGNVTSTVSANTDAGFSIVTFPADNTAGRTVGHGLGVAPKMIITKGRAQTTSWYIYNYHVGAGNYLVLNATAATASSSGLWGNTHPTSSVFTIGNGDAGYNSGGANDALAYCFADVEGYSKCGVYTGNGNADGSFVFVGFKPAWIMFKRTDGVTHWQIHDIKRSPVNPSGIGLLANTTDADGVSTTYNLDITSNGFKLRDAHAGQNASGGTYIYMAFAEAPFKYANAR